jgi:Fic family protein
MNSQVIARYDSPHQFEPLLPGQHVVGPLLERAGDLVTAAAALGTGIAGSREFRGLLRAMNSYDTNRIEGEHARPVEIEQALQKDFSANADIARKQRLAVAHIRTESVCEQSIEEQVAHPGFAAGRLYTIETLLWLHKELFAGLNGRDDLTLADGSALEPGALRSRQVAIGRHEPPPPTALLAFLRRWSEVYGGARRGEMSIVAAAAAHHRLAWIHPFFDGNGRVARLHTHLVLHGMGLTKGLWSPLRGFARTEQDYRALLQAGDEHRRGALDGRGNLSERALVDWIGYCLDTWIDQARFMATLLDVQGFEVRLKAALTFDQHAGTGARLEALRPLHYLFASGKELGRADFKAMTTLKDRLATELTSSLLKSGYLAADSPYGAVRFAVPRHALRFLFPKLWPEAEQDEGMLQPTRAVRHP